MVDFVTYRGSCIWRDRNINDDLAEEFTFSVEYLNAMVSAVRYINIVLRVNSNAVRSSELTWLVPWFTP